MSITPEQLAEYELRATMAERQRCAEIVQEARFGNFDTDFRSIISMIEGGMPLDDLKRLCGTNAEGTP